ncbi:MAG TPA: hypothetical protein PLJ47_01755 [Candidatus Hydrogenedentes bacterium]|nr:hypothetical protein [Candidatus Hydrogenedentota bacterium]
MFEQTTETSATTTLETQSHALARRDFFRKILFAAAGLTVAELTTGCATTGRRTPMSDEDISFCKVAEPFPGYCLTMWVFGHKTCSELFLSTLDELAPEVRRRILSAPPNLIDANEAARIADIIEEAQDLSPNATIKQLYLMTKVINYDALILKLQEIDPTVFPLAFAYQQEAFVPEAREALNELQSDSMVHHNGHKRSTLEDLYTLPHPKKTDGKPDEKHNKFRAISHAKKGAIFGYHGSQFSDSAARQAYLTTYNGPIKDNDHACYSTGCDDCDDHFCTMESAGVCTQMSDLADNCPAITP